MSGTIDFHELFRFVHQTVLRTCQVRLTPPVQTPVEIISQDIDGVPVILKLRPQPLQSVLADIAEQLADAAVDHQVERLGVLEFISTLPGEPETLGGRFGSLGLYSPRNWIATWMPRPLASSTLLLASGYASNA